MSDDCQTTEGFNGDFGIPFKKIAKCFDTTDKNDNAERSFPIHCPKKSICDVRVNQLEKNSLDLFIKPKLIKLNPVFIEMHSVENPVDLISVEDPPKIQKSHVRICNKFAIKQKVKQIKNMKESQDIFSLANMETTYGENMNSIDADLCDKSRYVKAAVAGEIKTSRPKNMPILDELQPVKRENCDKKVDSAILSSETAGYNLSLCEKIEPREKEDLLLFLNFIKNAGGENLNECITPTTIQHEFFGNDETTNKQHGFELCENFTLSTYSEPAKKRVRNSKNNTEELNNIKISDDNEPGKMEYPTYEINTSENDLHLKYLDYCFRFIGSAELVNEIREQINMLGYKSKRNIKKSINDADDVEMIATNSIGVYVMGLINKDEKIQQKFESLLEVNRFKEHYELVKKIINYVKIKERSLNGEIMHNLYINERFEGCEFVFSNNREYIKVFVMFDFKCIAKSIVEISDDDTNVFEDEWNRLVEEITELKNLDPFLFTDIFKIISGLKSNSKSGAYNDDYKIAYRILRLLKYELKVFIELLNSKGLKTCRAYILFGKSKYSKLSLHDITQLVIIRILFFTFLRLIKFEHSIFIVLNGFVLDQLLRLVGYKVGMKICLNPPLGQIRRIMRIEEFLLEIENSEDFYKNLLCLYLIVSNRREYLRFFKTLVDLY